jgi:hypothetical protein
LKNLIFTDPSESTNRVVYKVDLITGNNFNIISVTGLENVRTTQHKKRALLAQGWVKGSNSSVGAFKAFATARGLDLVSQNSDGSGEVIIVDYNSDFGASSW